MAIPRTVACAALATLFSATLVAQMSTATNTGYHTINCVKVLPGRRRNTASF